MKIRGQFGRWLCTLGISAALIVLPCAAAAQNRPPAKQSAPPPHSAPPNRAPTGNNSRNDRPPNAGVPQNAQRPSGNGARVVTPPPNVQERWRNMTPQDRQRVLQNEERLRRLPPAQQQVLRDRAQVWNRMTPEQREHIRTNVLPQWRQMPPDRKQAIRQRLRVLQNMPEYARNQRLNDPNFTRGMSEEDRSTLRDLSHLHVGGAMEPPNE
jgi:predicted Fe-S protein YdhL (DUF1289 family)